MARALVPVVRPALHEIPEVDDVAVARDYDIAPVGK